MQLIENVKRWWNSTTSNPSQWMVDWIKPRGNDSGVDFTITTPLEYAPLWNAVNKIAGHVGQLPLVLYRTDGDRREPATEHPAHYVMKRRANQDIAAHMFKETLTTHALLYGNGRALIVRNNRGEVRELVPLMPERCSIQVVDGRKWHIWRDDQGQDHPIPDREILHIAGLGHDGLQGHSVLELARNSWGLGLAAERTSARHFKHNAMPSMVIETPRGSFRDEGKAREFLARWNEFHEGGGKVGLMRDGMKAVPISVPGKDAEWLGQRMFQRQEAALWMLLESILGDDSSVSYNSLEQKMLAYLTNCLMRWLCKWEAECGKKLLTDQQQRKDTHNFKFTTAALLRASTKERYEVYSLAIANEIVTVNEVRAWEDMNPVEGGDERRNPNINPTPEPPPELPTAVADPEDQEVQNLRHLVAQERHDIISAVCRGGNVVQWLENYYQGPRWPSPEYAAAGLADMIELCGNHRHHELAAAVAAFDWESRVSVLLLTSGVR